MKALPPGPSASQKALPPAPERINLASAQRTRHILVGDATGGGHMAPGAPGKSEFPSHWSPQQIMHHISDVATDPRARVEQLTGPEGSLYTNSGSPSKIARYGTREGVPIKTVVQPAGEGIISGYPTHQLR